MDLLTTLLVFIGGYLIGSISFARLIGRRVAPDADLTSTHIKIEGASRDFEVKTVSATSLSMREGPSVSPNKFCRIKTVKRNTIASAN